VCPSANLEELADQFGASLKSGLDRRHELERALKETREQLDQVARLTALCQQRRRPYVPQPLSAQAQQCPAAPNPQPLQNPWLDEDIEPIALTERDIEDLGFFRLADQSGLQGTAAQELGR